MKVGDLVMLEHWEASKGIVVAELPSDGILDSAVSVLWANGELMERCPPRILKVISEV